MYGSVVQEISLDDLEVPAPVHVRVVGLRCEAEACNSASNALVPLELIGTAGKRAGQKRAQMCEKRAETLAKQLDASSSSLQPLESAGFQSLVLALGHSRVRFLGMFAFSRCKMICSCPHHAPCLVSL